MDKNERQAIKRQIKERERQAFLAAMPLAVDEVRHLFDFVADNIGPIGPDLSSSCDHSLRFAKEWCERNNLDDSVILEWLRENGGFCDCEILWNVDERLEEALAGQSR